MTDPLREPGFLTPHQLVAVAAAGNVFMTACPGSGKTRTSAVRIARLDADGKRVAGCSYTNVGAEQLQHVLLHDLRRTLGPMQYFGTLHGFLLRYVLYPFGHLVTRSPGAARVAIDTSTMPDVVVGNDRTSRRSIPLAAFCYQPDGTLVLRTRPPGVWGDLADLAATGQNAARRLKEEVARAGLVSADDAMYWTLRVLQAHPGIAAAVAGRFDEVLVDEAQDTSELQAACLRVLHATGALKSLVLVGDLEQSIFSFQGANREGCEALAQDCGLETVSLSENHRSSQLICDVAARFSARSTADHAVGPYADCDWKPEILLYPDDQPADAIDLFHSRLHELGIDPAQASVLARANSLVSDLNGVQAQVPIGFRPRAVGVAVSALRAGILTRRQIEAVDRILAFAAWGSEISGLDVEQRRAVRMAAMHVLTNAPDLGLDVRAWITSVRPTFTDAVALLTTSPAHVTSNLIRTSAGQDTYLARDAFHMLDGSPRAQTVHDVKGESRDAILVVAGAATGAQRRPHSVVWSSRFTGADPPTQEAEELRIAYVAVTRARRYVAVGLPSTTPQITIAAYEEAGFHHQTT